MARRVVVVHLNLQKKESRWGKTEMCRLESVNVDGNADKDNKKTCETLGNEANNTHKQTADISVQTECSLAIADMQGVYEKLVEKTEKIERLEEELTEGWRMWSDIQLRNRKLQQEVDSLTSSTDSIRAGLNDFKPQQTTTTALLESTISELIAQASSSKSENSILQVEAEALRRELGDCKKEKESFAVTLKEANIENQRLTGELSLTMATLDDARRENENRRLLREETSALLADRDSIERKVAALQRRLLTREAKLTSLRKDSKEKSITIATLQTAISSLQVKLFAAGALL